MTKVPFGEWLPDQPDLDNAGVATATNVIPRTTRSYGPWRGLSDVSTNALDERCLGSASAKDISDVAYTFAGDRTKLYRLLSNAFTDVSGVGGYATNTTTIEDYSVIWRFRQYRSLVDLMVATNYDDPIQSWTLGVSSAFTDLAPTTGPRARYMDILGDHLVLGNTFDSYDGARSSRIWFSPQGNPADDDWGNVNKLSDFQDLRSGGAIVGVVGGEFGLIFCETSIYQMIFAGAPIIFNFNEIIHNHGCIAPGSIAYNKNNVFYLSQDGFFTTTGGRPTPIGLDKVNKTFFNDIDLSNLGRITANIDPLRSLYCVAYPGSGNTDGTPNRILIFNYEIGRWTIVNEELDVLATTLSPGLTLEELAAIYATVEDIAGVTDDPQWAGGNEVFGAFTTNKMLAGFTGAKKAATIDTLEANVIEGRRAKRLRVRPLVDGDSTVSVSKREKQSDAKTFLSAQTPNSRSGEATFSKDAARYHSARLRINNQTWTEAHGVEVEAQDAGHN